MDKHLRCQIEYKKGFDNLVDVLIEDVKPVVNMDNVEKSYYFWQEYSERFHRHVQLDLIVSDEVDEDDLKDRVESHLEEVDRQYYWEEDFVSTWFARNDTESAILLDHRTKNAEIALSTLEAYREGNLDRHPSEFVNRVYHLGANQHGMTHWDEFKFCIKRMIQIPIIQFKSRAGLI